MPEYHHHQHYALNSKGDFVDIVTAVKEGGEYKCPVCNSKMIMRHGKKNAWHFAHPKDARCDYNQYLHTLAKVKIRDWFNSPQDKLLYLDEPITQVKCEDFAKCEIASKGKCINILPRGKTKQKAFNLKEFYDNATLEQPFEAKDGHTYIADILCPCKKTGIAPLFIEICVTHPCEEDKIKSGLRIVEINIKSEEDIDNIIKGKTVLSDNTVNLYGFIRHPESEIAPLERNLSRFVLFKEDDWKIYPDTCRHYLHRMTAFEIVFESGYINFKAIMAKAVSMGLAPRQKILCHYYGENLGNGHLCKASNKYRLPRYCKGNRYNCTHYEFNQEDYTKYLSEYEELKLNKKIVYEWFDIKNRYKYQF